MVRIQRILCPIDFSDFSRHAFDRALAIARSHDATVTALHVVPIALASPMLPYIEPASLGPFDISPGERARMLENLHHFLELDDTAGDMLALDTTAAPMSRGRFLRKRTASPPTSSSWGRTGDRASNG